MGNLQLSGPEWILVAVLSVVWAMLGYRLSENDRKTLGRTPWGLPSALWAFFWFLSLILGLVLYLIAHSTGVRRAQQGFPPHGTPAAGPSGSAPVGAVEARRLSAAEQFPAYPSPANSQPSPTQAPPVQPEAQVPAPQEAPPTSPHSPPAWHPDPSGRFEYRWWDGHQWTSQVATDGHHLIDTNPDQRIGPY